MKRRANPGLIGLAAVLCVTIVLVAALAIAGATGALRAPVENFLAYKLGRSVEIGDLRLNLLSLNPSLKLKGLRIANPEWAGSGPLADITTLNTSLRLLSLLKGRLVLSKFEMDRGDITLLRKTGGQANWKADDSPAEPLEFPTIRRFYLTNSHIKYIDEPRRIAFNGSINSEETLSNNARHFRLVSEGHLNSQPFSLTMAGAPLVNAQSGQPYPFTLNIRHGATHVTATGQLQDAFDFSNVSAKMQVTGANLADLYYLTGLAFPITRHYTLEGTLSRADDLITFGNFAGRVGASDLNGTLKVQTENGRPYLTGSLHSKMLDPTDAGVVFGGDEDTQHLLPDIPLEVNRLRNMDADVTYKAQAIKVETLPLQEVSLKLKLNDGHLKLDPLDLTLPQGRIAGSLDIDANADVPDVNIDFKLTGVRLEDFMRKAGQQGNALEGPLLARAQLKGKGPSVHQAAGNADGRVTLVIPGGAIRQTFAELLGINVSRALGLILAKSEQQTEIRCAIANFEATQGQLYARHVVFDTGVVLARGEGRVDLGSEGIDLTLRGQSKEPRLIHVMAPVRITGTLRHPQLGVQATGATAQAGIAAALGAALSPLAAILPFVDAGLAENANCTALMQRAEAAGVKIPAQAK